MLLFLNRVNDWLTRWFALVVLGSAVTASIFPGPFVLFLPHLSLLLGIVMFGMGATLKIEALRAVIVRPRFMIIGALLQYTIMPLGAWALAVLFRLPPEIAAGLVLLGASPGGTASNVVTYITRGDVALSVAMTTLSTVLSPILIPLLVLWLAGHWLTIPTLALFKSIFLIVLIPVVLGLLTRKFFTKTVERSVAALPVISILTVALIVGAITGRHAGHFWSTSWMVLAAVLCHNILGLALGALAAKRLGLPPPALRAVTIEVGMQNSGLATALAHVHLHPMAALPGVIASIWQNITGPMLATWWLRRGKSS